ncbi:MAG: hypothetical protein IIA88_12300 [Bacteroidetes bacterium]|nr:hypothetical protein [Bacteroidota bacterium]
MEKVTIYYHKENDTLDVWFGNPEDEDICEEAGDGFILKKNKKGEIKFISLAELSKEEVLSLVSNDTKTRNLDKGKYQITVKTVTTKLRVSHFQNYNEKESIKETLVHRVITEMGEF